MKSAAPRRGDAGFTLVELIVAIAILGVISFVLTEAVILGFKTTDATASDSSRSIGLQAVQSYFTGDVQSAQLVSRAEPATACATSTVGVFLHLSWTDDQTARSVSYSLDDESPAVPGERELVRWSCIDGGAPDKRMLGHFSFNPLGPLPLLAFCDDGQPCPDPPGGTPRTVTLKVPTDRPQEAVDASAPLPAVDLTVQRRTA